MTPDALADRLANWVRLDLDYCELNLVSTENWPSIATGGARAFGWLPPTTNWDAAIATFTFCVEAMCQSMEWMSEDGVDYYLNLVEFLLNTQVAVEEKGMDPTELQARLDRELWGLGEGAVEFLNEVQMEILDMQEA